jgi:hypothetical protein
VGGGVDVAKDLGFEWDTGLTYRPHERITWVNEFGFLFQVRRGRDRPLRITERVLHTDLLQKPPSAFDLQLDRILYDSLMSA